MAHRETHTEFIYRLSVERFLGDPQDTPTLWRPDGVADPYRTADEQSDLAISDGLDLKQYIAAMLDSGGFRLHYQPQVTAAGGLRGVEALLRLPHPKLGFISPELFIPIAEESGLIDSLGFWVIREACHQMKRWQDEFKAPGRIAVNVSPLQLRGLSFAGEVLAILAECGVDPACLELEITERVMLNLDDVGTTVHTLSQNRIHFALDDFGAGYSSLQNLPRLPLSTLKIDRSFLVRLCKSMGSAAIVEAIISIGHKLGMEVIAEGVEREYERQALLDLGCDTMQGYLFSPALPAELIRESMLRTFAFTRNRQGL